MKKLIFISLIGLCSCYSEEAPKPMAEKSQPEYKVVYNQLDSVKIMVSAKIQHKGQSIPNLTYTASQDCKVNVKSHLWLYNPSYGFQYFIRKRIGYDVGAVIGRNDLMNHKEYNSYRDIVANGVTLKKGETIDVFIHYSDGVTTIYPDGSHLGYAEDKSYFMVEAY